METHLHKALYGCITELTAINLELDSDRIGLITARLINAFLKETPKNYLEDSNAK